MFKKCIFFSLMAICFISCQGNKNGVTVVDNDSITCDVLGVNLKDNTTIIKEKLTRQGYHWKEREGSGGLCWVTVKEMFSFSGYYFEDLSFATFDAKIFDIHFKKECDSLESAQIIFKDLANKIETKYSKFKTDKQNDSFLKYIEYDDGKTNLSVAIDYHAQEKIQWFFDEDDKHRAREYWAVLIYYCPSNTNVENTEEKNDF